MENKMMKVALYARCGHRPNGNDDPINHQFRACREYAAQRGWEIVATYDDPNHSGFDPRGPVFRPS
jgi:hypothetical protein